MNEAEVALASLGTVLDQLSAGPTSDTERVNLALVPILPNQFNNLLSVPDSSISEEV